MLESVSCVFADAGEGLDGRLMFNCLRDQLSRDCVVDQAEMVTNGQSFTDIHIPTSVSRISAPYTTQYKPRQNENHL